MFMSNFTRSGRRANIWQSITNLSCCCIDHITKHQKHEDVCLSHAFGV